MINGIKFFRYAMPIAGALIVISIYNINRSHNNMEFFPDYHEIPLALGPLFTIIISFSIFGEYIAKCAKRNMTFGVLLQAISLIFMLFLCLNLAQSHLWRDHLIFMILIFLLFVIWDILMIRILDESDDQQKEDKQEILSGSIYINLPSLFAAIISISFLSFIIGRGGMGALTGDITTDVRINKIMSGPDRLPLNPAEMFTSGLVAFHLIISGLSYLFVSHKRKIVLLYHWLVRKISFEDDEENANNGQTGHETKPSNSAHKK